MDLVFTALSALAGIAIGIVLTRAGAQGLDWWLIGAALLLIASLSVLVPWQRSENAGLIYGIATVATVISGRWLVRRAEDSTLRRAESASAEPSVDPG